MKYILLIMLLSATGLVQSQTVKKITASTTLQRVTVFAAGAQLQRSATIPITVGRSEIVFSGLSNQLQQQTVQLKADASITLLSVQATKDFAAGRKIDDEERENLDKSNSVKDRLDMDIKLLAVYKNEEEMLQKNQAIGGQAGVKAPELKDALDLQRQRLTEVYQKQLELQKRIAAETADWEKAKAIVREIGKKKDSINYTVTALIDSKETRSVTFQLWYTVKDAGWYPTYDVRVTDVAKPLQVLMNANVFQRSGETWKDVALLLSTGNPDDNATPSQLQPWMLSFYDPSTAWQRNQSAPGTVSGRVVNENGEPMPGASITIRGTSTGTSTDANGFFKIPVNNSNSVAVVSLVGYQSKELALKQGYYTISLKAAAQNLEEVVVVGYGTLEGRVAGLDVSKNYQKKQKEELQTVTVVTQYQPTTVVYAIDERYSLETDGKTTTIGIRNFNLPALYDFYTAPKIDPAVFLTAKIVDWQDFDLMSGEASLYFEGTFLGKTYIDLTETPDTLALSLGKDNGIKVVRKLVKQYSSQKLIGSNRTEIKQYEISLRNTKHEPVTVRIEDQFPVSVTKEISVEDVKAPDAEINKETGIASWTITLQPGQEKKLQLSYNVKYPKDRRVVLY